MTDRNTMTAPLTLYIVRHPNSAEAKSLEEILYNHFGPARAQISRGGVPIRVHFSNAIPRGSLQPAPIAWNDSATTAVALLIDDVMTQDPVWVQYNKQISQEAEETGFRTRVIPIALSPTAIESGLTTQALRYHRWEETQEGKNIRLIREITYQLIRMLRHQIAEREGTVTQKNMLGAYMDKVKVFLSHSKNDKHGERIAKSIRSWLGDKESISTFLDVYDIPAGTPFKQAIEHNIEQAVMAVIYTDSYSSRDWCQHEILHAKQYQVPMLVVDCLSDTDERSFPYMGNAPYLRMDPESSDRMENISSRILEEMFKYLLWKTHVEHLDNIMDNITFMPRAPELVTLITHPELIRSGEWHIVYPEPPLSEREIQLIKGLGQQISLYSLTQWLSEEPS